VSAPATGTPAGNPTANPFVGLGARAVEVGPEVYDHLVVEAGGPWEASKILGMNPRCVTDWAKVGTPRLDCRPVWRGYPSPLPFLDRVAEERVSGCGGFLALLTSVGFDVASIRAGATVDLRSVLGPVSGAILVGALVRRPASAVRKTWSEPFGWPEPWVRLDRLSTAVLRQGWPEAVMGWESDPAFPVVPHDGLVALVDLADVRARGPGSSISGSRSGASGAGFSAGRIR